MKEENKIIYNYNYYKENYADFGFEGTVYLQFRDLPKIIERYVKDKKICLDYASGTGRGARFLKSLGLDVTGVDICQDMIDGARKKDSSIKYELIESAKLPYKDERFDVVFSGFIFLYISTMEDVVSILSEMKRVLKKGGRIIFLTSIVSDIKHKWISYDYDLEENNKDLTVMQKLKRLNKESDTITSNYFWTEKDYDMAIEKAGLRLVKRHIAMGDETDGLDWQDEDKHPHCYIYVLEK